MQQPLVRVGEERLELLQHQPEIHPSGCHGKYARGLPEHASCALQNQQSLSQSRRRQECPGVAAILPRSACGRSHHGRPPWRRANRGAPDGAAARCASARVDLRESFGLRRMAAAEIGRTVHRRGRSRMRSAFSRCFAVVHSRGFRLATPWAAAGRGAGSSLRARAAASR